MNIREDVKFGQITFNCVAISNFKYDCDADIMQVRLQLNKKGIMTHTYIDLVWLVME